MCLRQPAHATMFLWLTEAPPARVDEGVDAVECFDELQLSHGNLCAISTPLVRYARLTYVPLFRTQTLGRFRNPLVNRVRT